MCLLCYFPDRVAHHEKKIPRAVGNDTAFAPSAASSKRSSGISCHSRQGEILFPPSQVLLTSQFFNQGAWFVVPRLTLIIRGQFQKVFPQHYLPVVLRVFVDTGPLVNLNIDA